MITDLDGESYVVFDAHTHMGPRPIKSSVTMRGEITVSAKIAEMDAAGIDKAVVFPRANPHTDYREANETIIQAQESFPDRLVAFARIQPYFMDRAVADVKEYIARGVRGFKLHPLRDFSGNAINDEELIYPLMEAAQEGGVTITVHSGGSWNCTPSLIGELAMEFSNLDFIIAHCGGTHEHHEAISVAKRVGNVYLDVAEVVPAAVVTKVVDGVGEERILFGSDHPAMPFGLELDKVVKYAGLQPDQLRRVLSQNLEALLKVDCTQQTDRVDIGSL